MTKDLADNLVYEIASRCGYKFDKDHFFEYCGTWVSVLEGNLLSFVYRYHEPVRIDDNGDILPTGEPIYWICNDLSTRRMVEWAEFVSSRE